MAVPEQPLNYPLYGTFLELEGLRPDLAGVTAVALSGKSQKVAVADGVTKLSFLPGGDATKAATLNPGDVLTLIDPMPRRSMRRLDRGRPNGRPAAAH